MLHASLFIAASEGRGRGVFIRDRIAEGDLLEVSPVLVLSKQERVEVDKTLLHDYVFEWGPDREQCCVAWGYVSMYNHSEFPNCTYEMDFEAETIAIRTLRLIEAGEELLINYLPEEGDKPAIWFEVK
jgi:SET domain-containing protein